MSAILDQLNALPCAECGATGSDLAWSHVLPNATIRGYTARRGCTICEATVIQMPLDYLLFAVDGMPYWPQRILDREMDRRRRLELSR